MHAFTALLIIWAAIITQDSPGPVFGHDVEADPTVQIAQVVVVDQQGREIVLTPDQPLDPGTDVGCTWHKHRRVECRAYSGEGPVRVDYYLERVEHRQFVPIVARSTDVPARTADLPDRVTGFLP